MEEKREISANPRVQPWGSNLGGGVLQKGYRAFIIDIHNRVEVKSASAAPPSSPSARTRIKRPLGADDASKREGEEEAHHCFDGCIEKTVGTIFYNQQVTHSGWSGGRQATGHGLSIEMWGALRPEYSTASSPLASCPYSVPLAK